MTHRMHAGRALPLLFFLALPAFLPLSGVAQEPTGPLTAAERSDYRQTTRYDEVMEFLRGVVTRSTDMHLTSMGTTSEGRAIPLVIVGHDGDHAPEAIRNSEKARLYIQGGIHAGEISGKEALLILLRELAAGEHAHWADSLILLVAPLYNADGNERVSPSNRRGQHGPIEGMGQRANAMGLDLNRDQMKLDAPESRALVGLYSDYDPHLSVDLHTTNGTRHGYHLTYAPPLSPNTPPEIDELLRDRWLPVVTRQVKAATGWDMYYYGGARTPRGGGETGWYTFSHQPRYVSNYIGLRNRFGILGEAYAYASFEERIRISYAFTREVIQFAYHHASEIRQRTERADARSLVGDSLGLRAEPLRSREPVTILMGDVVREENPLTGEPMLLRTDTQIPTEMHEYGTFRPTEWERVPRAYVLAPRVFPEMKSVVDLLEAHGVDLEILDEPRDAPSLEAFMIDSLTTSSREYQGHRGQEVVGRYQEHLGLTELGAGTVIVPMDQPLARVVFKLLEPRSDDGLVAWGLLSDQLPSEGIYPILRIPVAGGP